MMVTGSPGAGSGGGRGRSSGVPSRCPPGAGQAVALPRVGDIEGQAVGEPGIGAAGLRQRVGRLWRGGGVGHVGTAVPAAGRWSSPGPPRCSFAVARSIRCGPGALLGVGRDDVREQLRRAVQVRRGAAVAGGWWWRVGLGAGDQDVLDGAVGRVTDGDGLAPEVILAVAGRQAWAARS